MTSASIKLKEAYKADSKHGAFYTGGNIECIESTLYCQTTSAINLVDIETGQISLTIGDSNSEESDYIQTFTTNGTKIVSSHKSGLLKLWNQQGELEKMWKYIHKGPIAKLILNGNKLASGGSDGVVRIWDLQFQACLLSLKGCHGVINVVNFCPHENLLFASGDDGNINSYELETGDLKAVYKAHYSKVTSVVFPHDCQNFVSSGRDKVIILWELNKNTPLRTIAVYEVIECMTSLPKKFKLPDFKSDPSKSYVATAGEFGNIRVWDVAQAKEVFVQTNSLIEKDSDVSITHLLHNPKSKSMIVVSSEHNIIIHHLKSFVCLKQFVGFTDEILDIAYVGVSFSHIAVATNSNDIKLFDKSTMSCQLLKGHTDIVLSLAVSKENPNLMLSSGKDNSVLLWHFDGVVMVNVGAGKRHTGSVGSVAFPQNSSTFAISASQDTCLKVWKLPTKFDSFADLVCTHTEIAHQKDINCVTISPNDKIIASASQDKTVKLWSDTLTLIGVLKGHKRGVWSVRFSPVDQVVLTSSADCTIKLWSVADLSCLKTLEGHESSVLKAEYLSKGMQILSAGADGLLKIFNIKNADCVCTLDEHDGRIWALAIKNDESEIFTGGSDSLLIKWRDITEEQKLERQKETEELALHEQKLSNYIHSNQLLKALKLSLKLQRPLQTLKIVQDIIKQGDTGLSDTIKSLRNDQKESLLKCALDWNTNSRNCHSAHLVLNVLMQELQTGEFRPVGLTSLVEGALPYTERHFKRLTQLMQDMHFLNYTVNCMKPHSKIF